MPKDGEAIESWEYLLHHLHEGDEPHHCNLIDHLGNLFRIEHAEVRRGGGQEAETVHVVAGLADDQEVLWSDEDAESAGYDVPCPGRQLRRASEGGGTMPYTGPDDPSLPANVKKLPEKDRGRWVAIWNRTYRRCQERDGQDCEAEAFRIANGVVMSKKTAEWTTAYVNDLPDSAFLWIAPGGEKDEEGKTKPRSLRYFPYKDADGKVDLPHLRNAIARIPQATHPDLTDELKQRLQEKARAILERETAAKGAAEEPLTHGLSMDERCRLVQAALEERHVRWNAGPDKPIEYPWIRDLFEDQVIYSYGGKLWSSGYSIDETGEQPRAILADPVPVRTAYVRAAEGEFPSRAFLSKLRELLAEKVKDGVLGQEEFDECVRLARAHAGGVARAERIREGAAGDDDAEKAAGEVADLCALGRRHRLFVQVRSFVEPPEWLPVLPKPGSYSHPAYGEIKITRKRNERFVDNFNSGVYQDRLPVDAEHETKASGALGWIVEMRLNDDGSADGRVEWNERGETMLSEDRFAYTSPEWYDEWTDPASGEVHRDVLIGVALTTRPFFKEKSLRPLVAASEGDLYLVDRGAAAGDEPRYVRLPSTERSRIMKENQPGVAPVQGTEELTRQFAELKAQLDQERQAREAAESQAKQAAERVAALETAARKKRFEDVVYGRADGPDGSIRFFGEPAKHVDFLMKLAERFGEESEEVKFYIEEKRTQAKQLAESELLRARGTSAPAVGSPEAKLDALARQKVESSGGKLSYAKAYAEALEEHPELYQPKHLAAER